MRLDRRHVLKGGALAGVAAAVPLAAKAAVPAGAALVVYDSRIAESVDFANGSARRIDLAQADAEQWQQVRALAGETRIEGLTRWSDWVAVRGVLEAQGLRLASELRAEAPLSGRAHLFRWSMTAR